MELFQINISEKKCSWKVGGPKTGTAFKSFVKS